MPDFAVILAAGGASSRFGGSQSKLLEPLGGKPLVRHTLAAFARRRDVKLIVVAAAAGAPIRRHIPTSALIIQCDGGTCRAQSVRNALMKIPPGIEWVAVHDAARPLVSKGLIDRTLATAQRYGAAVPAVAVVQTIKRAVGPLPAKAMATLAREQLWAVQTPQIMRRAALLAAFERCPIPLEQVTDDAQLLELAGQEVWLVAGEEANLKITTPADLQLAHLIGSHRSKPPGRPSDIH